ncbi:hypothetical protein LPC08_24425 (plasmid) [Roseomonas sp. OT10]|uniref:hypothetical protein n=1 Tax=Roseomonas cutis TaxID=2897332 RepID=UPI001E60DEE9|nr:hypothetical protein [Roseomonas sp. OT10]UFN51669.1 hypothetical protein LPC08_24425 [Roseomonas sp. OT10]
MIRPSVPPSPAAVVLAGDLRAAFLRLPPDQQRRCRVPPSGDARLDRPVLVEADDHSDHYQGIIVAGLRDDDGVWLLDASFTLLTLDGDGPQATLVRCLGWNCRVEPL